MKINTISPRKSLVRITLSLGAGAALSLISGLGQQPALAQSTNPSDSELYPSNEQDSFSGGMGGSSFNPIDLMHRANLGNERSMGEYMNDQQESLSEESTDFRRQQQQLMQNQQSSSPDNSATTPTTQN
jgi:hypothetical protein